MDLLAQSTDTFKLFVCDGVTDPCTFLKLMELVRSLITLLIYVSTVIVAGAFIYAGFKLLTSGGNPGALSDAKKMMWSIIEGYLWILGAWAIVYTIVTALLRPGYSLLG